MYEPSVMGADLLDAIAAAPTVGTANVFPLGQSGIIVRFAETTVAVDLYLSNHLEGVIPRPFDHRRLVRAPLDPAEIEMLDVIICSHEHLDHLDIPTLRTLRDSSPRSIVVVPVAARSIVLDLGWPEERVIGTHGGERIEVAGVTVTAFGVPHEKYDEDAQRGHRYQGYCISGAVSGAVTSGVAAGSGATVSIGHVGDSLADDRLAATLKELDADLLCLPINGRDELRQSMGFAGNMNAEESIELALAAGARAVLPLHDDMFAQNIDRDARERFMRAAHDAAVTVVRPPVGGHAAIPAVGESARPSNWTENPPQATSHDTEIGTD